MRKLKEDYREGDKVVVDYKEDDGGGWYYSYKKKKGTVHFDEQGFYVKTNATKHVRIEDLISITRDNN